MQRGFEWINIVTSRTNQNNPKFVMQWKVDELHHGKRRRRDKPKPGASEHANDSVDSGFPKVPEIRYTFVWPPPGARLSLGIYSNNQGSPLWTEGGYMMLRLTHVRNELRPFAFIGSQGKQSGARGPLQGSIGMTVHHMIWR